MTLLRSRSLHFAALGAALFVAVAWLDLGSARESPEIVVSAAQVRQLVAEFTRMNRRPPSTAERDALIGDHLRGEVAYREALALGLDRDDAVIRHRLREKMEFLMADVSATLEPSEAQLETYLREHADAFRVEPRYTFEQLYLDPQRRPEPDAAGLLAQLNAGDAAAVEGDPFLLDRRFDALPASAIGNLFGEPFATRLADLAPGAWHGPIDSGYGRHLVRVVDRRDSRIPPLDEVRAAVRREWLFAQRATLKDAFYAGLLSRYAITIDDRLPPP